ncbi:hypothetical protein Vi05172_g1350 [Venturia inaequalis]|nr:hypothetical protein Vi05172_g1350 [Venturia inaequalis]
MFYFANMHLSHILLVLIVPHVLLTVECQKSDNEHSSTSDRIISSAASDGIPLDRLPFSVAAFQSIDALRHIKINGSMIPSSASKVDVHTHAVPDFYATLVPVTGGSPTPHWDLETHLNFMASNGIAHSILSISTPGSVVFIGNETYSVGLARLLNEWMAEVVRLFPQYISFYAVTPLPYVSAALKEVKYSVDKLGAVGIGLMSNHEGYYLGNPLLRDFFAELEIMELRMKSKNILVHPTLPSKRLEDGGLADANPTVYTSGRVEFYFETARTVMDLTFTQTFQNFTSLKYIIPHCGGAFPSIEDRSLSSNPRLKNNSQEIYNTRLWYDSAGPTFPHQVQGLLAYGVPKTQLVYGSDFPYSQPNNSYGASIAAIGSASFLTDDEKEGFFSGNAKRLFD